jgi:ATP-dependent Lon protease
MGFPLSVAQSFCTTDSGGEDKSDLEALGRLSKDEREHLSRLSVDDIATLCTQAQSLRDAAGSTVTPLRFRVLASPLPVPFKQRICMKLERLGEHSQSSEASKYTSWVEACLALPLNSLTVPQLPLTQPLEQILHSSKEHLDSVVFGHKAAKQAVLERVFSWYTNPQAPQRPLAFCGAPGNGKTTMAKRGLGPLLGRPVNFVSLGGAHDCSTLVGHGYTFEASQPGRIVECLWASRCMNPIIYFDELDKISETPKGEEISNVLVHLTDTTQNDTFRDRFLHGLDLDLSRALLVFSFNDISKVPRVLLERMQVVYMEPFSHQAQREVVTDFLMPQALSRVGMEPGSVCLGDRALELLLERIDTSTGLRGALDVLDQLVTKTSLWLKVRDKSLTHPLGPSHFSEDKQGHCILSADAVDVICSEKGSRPRVLSMYS